MKGYRVGDKVRALMVITDDGELPADLDAEFESKLKPELEREGGIRQVCSANPSFVHALPGDIGEVEHIEPMDPYGPWYPTVRFARKGTATRVRGLSNSILDDVGMYPEIEPL